MRRVLILALALALAPVGVSATERPLREAVPPQVQQPVTQLALPHAERIEVPARAEQSRDAEEAVLATQPDRVQWWWLVAAIVVGGIIVAVLV